MHLMLFSKLLKMIHLQLYFFLFLSFIFSLFSFQRVTKLVAVFFLFSFFFSSYCRLDDGETSLLRQIKRQKRSLDA